MRTALSWPSRLRIWRIAGGKVYGFWSIRTTDGARSAGAVLGGFAGAICPECGKPVAESIDAARTAPAWEHPEVHRPAAFVSTTAAIIFRPTQFYRTLATRLHTQPAKNFARWHWMIAAALFTLSAYVHSW